MLDPFQLIFLPLPTIKKIECWRINAEESMLSNCGAGEKTLKSPLGNKEIQPVHPKGNQSWIFIGSFDAKAETPILWPPDAKNWLTGKYPDAGKDWGQEEKGTTEDEVVGWHHWLNRRKSEQTQGDNEGQEAWCAAVHGVTKSWTWFINWTTTTLANHRLFLLIKILINMDLTGRKVCAISSVLLWFSKGCGWGAWGWYPCWEPFWGSHGNVSNEGQVRSNEGRVRSNEEQDTVKQLSRVCFLWISIILGSLVDCELPAAAHLLTFLSATAVLSFLPCIQMQTAVHSFFTIVSHGSFCPKHMDTCSDRNFIFLVLVKYWTASGRVNGRRERGNEKWLDAEGARVCKLEGRQNTSRCFSGTK